MIKFLLVFVIISIIFLIFWRKNYTQGNIKKSNFYRNILILIIAIGILFFISTAGRFILPQIFQILKMALPLLTRFIGI